MRHKRPKAPGRIVAPSFEFGSKTTESALRPSTKKRCLGCSSALAKSPAIMEPASALPLWQRPPSACTARAGWNPHRDRAAAFGSNFWPCPLELVRLLRASNEDHSDHLFRIWIHLTQ